MAEARVVRSAEGEVYDPTWVFKQGSLTGGAFDFMIGAVTYLAGPPLHVHDEQHDTFYVLDGILTIQIGDEVLELGPGDFATVPPGIAHTFDNVHEDQPPVKVCNFMTPGGLDQLFVSLNELGSDAMHDPEQLAGAGKRNGVTFAGPTIGEKLALT
jgi:quercetin dioxygenase-like cupin family protein